MLFELEPECAMARVRLATAHPSRKMPRTLAVSHDDSHHLRLSQSGADSQPACDATQPGLPLHKLAAGCLGKCKSSILSKFSQGTPAQNGAPGARAGVRPAKAEFSVPASRNESKK